MRQQRDRWVVRVDGIDTASGKSRPRQLGTFRSKRSAQAAATAFASCGEVGSDRSTVGYVVTQWAESRTDIGNKSRLQYEWAARHIAHVPAEAHEGASAFGWDVVTVNQY